MHLCLSGGFLSKYASSSCCSCVLLSSSLPVVLQVSWLLLALLQDQPGNRHIRQFRDACEHAALMGGAVSSSSLAARTD
jgi:hypothetical protein